MRVAYIKGIIVWVQWKIKFILFLARDFQKNKAFVHAKTETCHEVSVSNRDIDGGAGSLPGARADRRR